MWISLVISPSRLRSSSTFTVLARDDNASSLWVGTDLGLFRLLSQDNGWKIANEFLLCCCKDLIYSQRQVGEAG